MTPPARPTTTMRSGDQPWRQTWLSVDQWSWVSTSRTVTTCSQRFTRRCSAPNFMACPPAAAHRHPGHLRWARRTGPGVTAGVGWRACRCGGRSRTPARSHSRSRPGSAAR
ncbi:hypothetical protein G6F59_018055 [Rhizopus arrhizus]|nr:hypothetical protein G6F59_018055 [Rhizopus arrhizus]